MPDAPLMTGWQRLAAMFGVDRGKDRKAAHRGQHDRPRTRARRARYARAAARAAKG